MELHAGQCWTYRAPSGFETSRLVIGAIVKFDGDRSIVCCSVTGAPRRHPDGRVEAVLIPFLPMTEHAFRDSVVAFEGDADLPPVFAGKLDEWANDPRGLTTFTVAFEGYLDRMIALQMAEIAGQNAA
jgi:hypothetical protein